MDVTELIILQNHYHKEEWSVHQPMAVVTSASFPFNMPYNSHFKTSKQKKKKKAFPQWQNSSFVLSPEAQNMEGSTGCYFSSAKGVRRGTR